MNHRKQHTAHLARAAELKAAKRLRRQRAEIHALLDHCRARSKTRKRSVEKLMAERGWVRVAESGHVEAQWARA